MTHPAFTQTAHRPWPLPRGAWRWRQSWRDLLFAHWPAPVEAVRQLIPAGLEVDTFDGATWLGIVPFRMAGVTLRPLPDLPWLSAFPELNVRVYVTRDGKPGVWFLSLDATRLPAVVAARLLFHLPYYWARIDITPEGDGFAYRSVRRNPIPHCRAGWQPASWPGLTYRCMRRGLIPLPLGGARGGPAAQGAQDPLPNPLPRGEGTPMRGGQDPLPNPLPRGEGTPDPLPQGEGTSAILVARYWPTSHVYTAAPGTLEHWLTERYALYATAAGGTLYRTEVHHHPWPLQRAAAEFAANTVSAAGGLPVAGPPAYLHFARRLDVVVWSPERV